MNGRILNKDDRCRPYYTPGILLSGITGPMGPTGPVGPATISVGTTTTLPAGTEANVVNSGTDENVVLDFSIPAGPTGETPTLMIGTVTTGTPGGEASASITGTSPNYVK